MENQALRFLEEEIQYVALTIMGLLYLAKVLWLMKKPAPADKAPLKGNRVRGGLLSIGNIFTPWAMPSTKKHWWFYFEFCIFHMGVALSILATFLIPPKTMLAGEPISKAFGIWIAAAFLVGLRRLLRRLTSRQMRIISTMDDYFAIFLLELYFLSAIWALETGKNLPMAIFFGMTTFFLLYVPFSKISHYIIYPFSRYFYGTTFGGRGVFYRRSK